METVDVISNLLESAGQIEKTQEKILETVQAQNVTDFVAILALLNVVLGVVKLTAEVDEREGKRMASIITKYFTQQMEAELNDIQENKKEK
jgi:hypothetical protein